MFKELDKLWCWQGWTIIKWPFGFFILFSVIFTIYNTEINPNYDKETIYYLKAKIDKIENGIHQLDWSKLFVIKSPKIKNIN